MISEKNDRVVGSSSSSKPIDGNQLHTRATRSKLSIHFACLSHSAESRISASLMLLFELEYIKRLQWKGWNSVLWWLLSALPLFTGLISTISVRHRCQLTPPQMRRWTLTKTLVANIEIPQIDSQIVGGNVRLLIWIDGDRMYVISMCICVDFAGYRSNDILLMCHSRKS